MEILVIDQSDFAGCIHQGLMDVLQSDMHSLGAKGIKKEEDGSAAQVSFSDISAPNLNGTDAASQRSSVPFSNIAKRRIVLDTNTTFDFLPCEKAEESTHA